MQLAIRTGQRVCVCICVYVLNLFQSNAKRCPNQEKMLSIWILTTSTDTWNKQFGATIDVRWC